MEGLESGHYSKEDGNHTLCLEQRKVKVKLKVTKWKKGGGCDSLGRIRQASLGYWNPVGWFVWLLSNFNT